MHIDLEQQTMERRPLVHSLNTRNRRWIVHLLLLVYLGGMTIAAIGMGGMHHHDPCQGEDPTGLTLDDWMLGASVSDLLILTLLELYIYLASENRYLISGVWIFFCMCTWCLFSVGWIVLGVVIVARSHGSCISDGRPLGVMTLLVFVNRFLMGLHLYLSTKLWD